MVLSSEEEGYAVILVKDPLVSLGPLRGNEIEFVAEGYDHIIKQREDEIFKLKEIERLKKLANDQPTRT